MTASFYATVYYEDTDSGGVVYYANYLKFAERARTELLREKGFGQAELWEKHGIGFAVRRVEADYLKPARLDDRICVETVLQDLTQASITMHQRIVRNDEELVRLNVRLACIGKDFKPVRMPKEVYETLLK